MLELADDINDNLRKSRTNEENEAFVAIRDGTFGWTAENPVLKDVL